MAANLGRQSGWIHRAFWRMKGDSMVLATAAQTVPKSISPTGRIVNRMVYYHITTQAFDWCWESSTDDGTTWKTNWLIHYKRKI